MKSYKEDGYTNYYDTTVKRRRDVYKRGLSKIGFRFNMLFGTKVLSKNI